MDIYGHFRTSMHSYEHLWTLWDIYGHFENKFDTLKVIT